MLSRSRSTEDTVASARARRRPWNGNRQVGVGRTVELAGVAAIVVGSFGPWLRSGDRVRTSYELFQVVDRLGFLGEGALSWLPRAWSCVPLLAALALLGHVRGAHRAGAAIAALVAGASLTVAGGVLASPMASDWGSVLGVVGAVVTLAGVIVPLLTFGSPISPSAKETPT